MRKSLFYFKIYLYIQTTLIVYKQTHDTGMRKMASMGRLRNVRCELRRWKEDEIQGLPPTQLRLLRSRGIQTPGRRM